MNKPILTNNVGSAPLIGPARKKESVGDTLVRFVWAGVCASMLCSPLPAMLCSTTIANNDPGMESGPAWGRRWSDPRYDQIHQILQRHYRIDFPYGRIQAMDIRIRLVQDQLSPGLHQDVAKAFRVSGATHAFVAYLINRSSLAGPGATISTDNPTVEGPYGIGRFPWATPMMQALSLSTGEALDMIRTIDFSFERESVFDTKPVSQDQLWVAPQNPHNVVGPPGRLSQTHAPKNAIETVFWEMLREVAENCGDSEAQRGNRLRNDLLRAVKGQTENRQPFYQFLMDFLEQSDRDPLISIYHSDLVDEFIRRHHQR